MNLRLLTIPCLSNKAGDFDLTGYIWNVCILLMPWKGGVLFYELSFESFYFFQLIMVSIMFSLAEMSLWSLDLSV